MLKNFKILIIAIMLTFLTTSFCLAGASCKRGIQGPKNLLFQYSNYQYSNNEDTLYSAAYFQDSIDKKEEPAFELSPNYYYYIDTPDIAFNRLGVIENRPDLLLQITGKYKYKNEWTYKKLNLIESYLNLGDFSKAREIVDSISSSTPNDSILNYYVLSNDIETAIQKEMEQINNKEDSEEYSKLANLYYRKGDYKSAFKYAKKTGMDNEEIPTRALNTMLSISLKMNDLNTAQKIADKLEKALSSGYIQIPDRIAILFNMSLLNYLNNDKSGEELVLRKILLFSDEANNNYLKWVKSLVYYNLGDYQNALKELNKYIDKAEGQIGIILNKSKDTINNKSDNRWYVFIVEYGSPAMKAGIRSGDLITAIDGENIYTDSLNGENTALHSIYKKLNGADGSDIIVKIKPKAFVKGQKVKKIDLKLKREKRISYNLADYYGLRSIIYRRLGEKVKSIQDYNKAEEINPNAYSTLIAKYLFLKDDEKTVEANIILTKLESNSNIFPLIFADLTGKNQNITTLPNVTVGVPQIWRDDK